MIKLHETTTFAQGSAALLKEMDDLKLENLMVADRAADHREAVGTMGGTTSRQFEDSSAMTLLDQTCAELTHVLRYNQGHAGTAG